MFYLCCLNIYWFPNSSIDLSLYITYFTSIIHSVSRALPINKTIILFHLAACFLLTIHQWYLALFLTDLPKVNCWKWLNGSQFFNVNHFLGPSRFSFMDSPDPCNIWSVAFTEPLLDYLMTIKKKRPEDPLSQQAGHHKESSKCFV